MTKVIIHPNDDEGGEKPSSFIHMNQHSPIDAQNHLPKVNWILSFADSEGPYWLIIVPSSFPCQPPLLSPSSSPTFERCCSRREQSKTNRTNKKKKKKNQTTKTKATVLILLMNCRCRKISLTYSKSARRHGFVHVELIVWVGKLRGNQ